MMPIGFAIRINQFLTHCYRNIDINIVSVAKIKPSMGGIKILFVHKETLVPSFLIVGKVEWFSEV